MFAPKARTKDDPINPESSLINTYVSKKGVRSLIYNPTVSLVLSGTEFSDDGREYSIMIPVTKIYTLETMILEAADALSGIEFINQDPETLEIYYKDSRNEKIQKHIAIYNKELCVEPSMLYEDLFGDPIPVVRFHNNEGEFYGFIMQDEIQPLCDVLDHLDITVVSLIVAVMDSLYNVNTKVDEMDIKLSKILKILEKQNEK